MTEKHIWKNGETITADLLNGMSDYVDDKASTAVTDVGGQKPTNGKIDMSAYPKIDGDNTWRGVNDFRTMPKIGGYTLVPQLSRRALVDSDDLFSTVTDNGIYWLNGGANNIKNWPTGAPRYGRLLLEDAGPSIKVMTWTTYNGVWRAYYSGAPAKWGAWERMVTNADITTLNNKIAALEAQISGGGAQPD